MADAPHLCSSIPNSPCPIPSRTQLVPPTVRFRAINIQSFFTSQHWRELIHFDHRRRPAPGLHFEYDTLLDEDKAWGRLRLPAVLALVGVLCAGVLFPVFIVLSIFFRLTLRAGRCAPVGGFRRCPSIVAGGQISSPARYTGRSRRRRTTSVWSCLFLLRFCSSSR